MTAKRCSVCSEEKDVSAFTKHRGSRDGLETICRECKKRKRRGLVESVPRHGIPLIEEGKPQAMGHCFGQESLKCINHDTFGRHCPVDWYHHQADPQPCRYPRPGYAERVSDGADR